MPRVIVITEYQPGETGPGGFGGFDVQIEDKIADGLTWDEMLGQIARMTMGLPLFQMRTLAEINCRRWDHYFPEDPCDDFDADNSIIF